MTDSTRPPNKPPSNPPPSGPPPSSPPKSADDLFDLADTLGFQTPARRDPLKAPAMAFVAVASTGGPVLDGRAGGEPGTATFTLPRDVRGLPCLVCGGWPS
jgi:hypothetical protein